MKYKVCSILLSIVILCGFMVIGDVNALEEAVCKQQTHWYYFSLADPSSKEQIEGNVNNTNYATKFSKASLPADAKINSVTTYKGFTKEDIGYWFDLYVDMKTPTYTDLNNEVHHVHDYLYQNVNQNSSSTANVDDTTRYSYDAIRNQGSNVTSQFRHDYIERIYKAQIIPTTADIKLTNDANEVNAQIARSYGNISLNSVEPYSYMDVNINQPVHTYLISAKAKVIIDYDCTVPEVLPEEPKPEEPKPEEPKPEEPKAEEIPLVKEINPNTGDLGVILSGLMTTGALTTGLVAYRKRKIM